MMHGLMQLKIRYESEITIIKAATAGGEGGEEVDKQALAVDQVSLRSGGLPNYRKPKSFVWLVAERRPAVPVPTEALRGQHEEAPGRDGDRKVRKGHLRGKQVRTWLNR